MRRLVTLITFLALAVTACIQVPATEPASIDTLPPGSKLPTGEQCADLVTPTPENVPENTERNNTAGAALEPGSTYLSRNIKADHLESRIDGNYTGTTDEIIQWAACKWGFAVDNVRAQAYSESRWYAGRLGDCGVLTVPETDGCSSVGIMQIKSACNTEPCASINPNVYPAVWESTAMNLDYGLAIHRACYEGLEPWLNDVNIGGVPYSSGSAWGCMGRWFAGRWLVNGAQDYMGRVAYNMERRTWETEFVGCPDWQTTNHCSR